MSNRLIRDDDEPIAAERPAAAPAPVAAPNKASLARKWGRGPYPGKRQVTAHIDEGLYKWLRSMSVQTDKPMVVMFEEALSTYVQKFAAQKRFAPPES